MALLVFILCASGCGSSGSSSSPTSPGNPASQSPTATTASLTAVLKFALPSKIRPEFADIAASYQVQVFTLTGSVLASRSGSREPGSGSVTLTFTELPAGTPLIVRVTLSDSSGRGLGFQDQGVTLTAGSLATSITFGSLTPAPTPTPPPEASPSPAASPGPTGPSPVPGPSPSPTPGPSPVPAPSPSPVPAPSPSPASGPSASPTPTANPRSLTIRTESQVPVGSSISLQVIATFDDGSTRDVTAQVSLSSSNPAVVRVQGNLLLGVGPGQAVLSAQLGQLSAATSVLVYQNPVGFQPPPSTPAPTPTPTPVPTPTPPPPSVYFGDLIIGTSTGTVQRCDLNGGPVTTFVSGVQGPVGLGFDSAHNLYIADQGGTVYKTDPGGTNKTILATGLTNPVSLVVDAGNNVFVATGTTVTRITQGATVVVNPNFSAGYASARGLALDQAGTLYVGDVVSSTFSPIYQVNPTTGALMGTFSFVSNGTPRGWAQYMAWNNSFLSLYIAAANTNLYLTSGGGTLASTLPYNGGIGQTGGIGFDPAGNLYVADSNGNRVFKIPPAVPLTATVFCNGPSPISAELGLAVK